MTDIEIPRAEWVYRLIAVLDHHYPPPTTPPEPHVIEPFGRGRQCGPLVPEYGPNWMHVRCDQCGATWVGHEGDECGWCPDWPQPAAIPSAPEIPGWVACPEHLHAWQGRPGELCCANGGPRKCRRQAGWLTRARARQIMKGTV